MRKLLVLLSMFVTCFNPVAFSETAPSLISPEGYELLGEWSCENTGESLSFLPHQRLMRNGFTVPGIAQYEVNFSSRPYQLKEKDAFSEILSELSFVDGDTIRIVNASNPQYACTYYRLQKYFYPSLITDEAKFIPFVKLDKAVYSSGEAIRFWTGVISTDDDVHSWEECSPRQLEITSPSGNREVIEYDGPHPDANEECGSIMGGSGLPFKERVAGQYSIVFDVKGQRTQPAVLTIQDSNPFQDLNVLFAPVSLDQVKVGDPLMAELSIKNNLKTTVRFPEFGVDYTLISMHVAKDGQGPAMLFYPVENLLDPKYKAGEVFYIDGYYTWQNLERIPSVVLQPGEEFKIQLPLNEAYDFTKPGTYQISLMMEFEFLMGEPEGRSEPSRLPVSWTHVFRIIE